MYLHKDIKKCAKFEIGKKMILLIAILMVYSAKAGIVHRRLNQAIVQKHKRPTKREASRGGGRIPSKTICGRHLCVPDEYKSICGLSEGVRKPKASSYIINGTCAPEGSQPWIVQIQDRFSGNVYQHHCGGVIITEDHILTAAHCFKTFDLTFSHQRMRVVIGQYNLDKEDSEEMIFNIEDVFLHEKWNNRRDKLDVKHDIALIKIRRKGDGTGIELSGKSGLVRPACLPSRNSDVDKDASACTIAGWGATKVKKENKSCLRSANVPLISNRKCKRLFEKSSNPKQISKEMICAGLEGGTDSCTGDSGGPLTCHMKGKSVLHGIVSWGDECGGVDTPGVYTRVEPYLDWINEKILHS